MKKHIFTIAIAIIIIFSGVYLLGGKNNNDSKYLVLTLEYGNGERQEFRTSSLDEKKAWNLLQQAAALSDIALEPTDDFSPRRINGFKNGLDDKKWNFYINDVKQEESPLNIKVSPPDKVAFRFE